MMNYRGEQHIDPSPMKCLLCVPQCDPDDVGESLWGFRIASGVASFAHVTIVTMPRRGREGVVQRAIPSATVYEIQEIPFRHINERFAAIAKPSLYKFYFKGRRLIRRLCKENRYDLAHAFTPASPRYPTPASSVPRDIPLLLGPISGSVPTPAAYLGEVKKMAWYTRLRGLDSIRLSWDPLLVQTFRRANLLLAATSSVEQTVLPKFPNVKSRRFLQIGLTDFPPVKGPSVSRYPSEGLRLLYVGRLVRTKGAIYAIRAMAELHDIPGISLHIVGDGDDRGACEQAIKRLACPSNVRLLGKLSHKETLAEYAKADLFVFPSIREPAGNVLLEAMSYSLPVICVDNGGPSDIVSDSIGFKIQPVSPVRLPSLLAEKIRELSADHVKRQQMGIAARRIAVAKHQWSQKIDELKGIYRELASVK